MSYHTNQPKLFKESLLSSSFGGKFCKHLNCGEQYSFDNSELFVNLFDTGNWNFQNRGKDEQLATKIENLNNSLNGN